MKTLTQKLVKALDKPISQADRVRAAHLLIDWTGCAVAGRKEPAGEKMAAAFPDESGPCSRIGSSKSSPLMAALHNGALGNVLEMDDVDKRAVLHAAPTVIPAALAMAEYADADGRDLLDAIIKGYEATIRIGRAVGPGHYAFWHNTATCGPFGAAIAACHLLEGSDPVSALGLAGTQAAGLWQTRHESDSMAKQLHAGHAAHAGVLAAILSAQGFQGPRTILDGEQGFFAAMCPGAKPEDVLADYGDSWLHHQTSFKPYPACRHAHPVIDALSMATEKNIDFSMGDIVIETYADAIKFCDRPRPLTKIEAMFSLQHIAAVTILKGVPTLHDFTEDSIYDLKISELRDRIIVKESEQFNDKYPMHYGASVNVSGDISEVQDALGDPENPINEKQLIEKMKSLFVYAGLETYRASTLAVNAASFPLGNNIGNFSDALP